MVVVNAKFPKHAGHDRLPEAGRVQDQEPVTHPAQAG